jgi:hypothetical protein
MSLTKNPTLILFLLSFCISYAFTASTMKPTSKGPGYDLRHIVNPGYELSEHDDYGK